MKSTVIKASLALLMSYSLSLQAQESTKIDSNVIYGMHSGLALLMDVYLPAEPNGFGIVVIPGSGFHQLMSYDATPLNKNPWYLKNILGTDNLLDHGYTLFVLNHRSSPIFRYPAAVEDVQRAVQFIRHHAEKYSINPTRLGAIGHSSGAHLASMLGTLDDIKRPASNHAIDRESSKVQAVATLAGVFDMTTWATSGFGDIAAGASFIGTHLPAWRGDEAPNEYEYEIYQAASPITHVTSDDPAFLVVHGTNENVTNPQQSKNFHARLLASDVSSKLLIIENADHGLRIEGKVANDQYFPAVINLFNKEVRRQ